MSDPKTAMRYRVAAAMHAASGGESLIPFAELHDVSPRWHETLLIQADAAVSECTREIERRLVGRFKGYARRTGSTGPAWAEGMFKADKTIAIIRALIRSVRGRVSAA